MAKNSWVLLAILSAVWCGWPCSELLAQLPQQPLAQPADPSLELARTHWKQELERIAQICISLNLHAEAEMTKAWAPQAPANGNLLYLPCSPPAVSSDNAAQTKWGQHFQAARSKYAQALFEYARKLADAGDEAAAFRTLWQVLREDDAHVEAKRTLGTLSTAATVGPRLRKGTVPHPIYGWPAGSYSRIETPHFSLTTRGAPQPSIELAQEMERYYALWRQVFYPLWAAPGVLANKLHGRNTPWEKSHQMSVVLLKDRNEYLRVLDVAEKNAAVSVGYYSPQAKTSFFYMAEDYKVTLYHELTHQLFAETMNLDAKSDVSDFDGVWLVEGIALYMESLTHRGTYWTLGGMDAPRLQTARYRAIRDGYWSAWPEFTGGTIEQWKQSAEISLLYTQATGLTHLFMDRLPQPQGREALLRCLVGVYQQQADFQPLLHLLGPDDAAAKLAYQQALTLTEADVESLVQSRHLPHDLVLAGSQLSSAGWSSLRAIAANLEWLDVSFSNASSADLEWLSTASQLQRLSVEGTSCDVKLLKNAAQLPELNELDLSGCPIDDKALKELGGHPQLVTLWLSHTQITQSALETLKELPKLQNCYVDGTQISPAAWEKFQREHLQGK